MNLPDADTEAMNEHRQEIATQMTPGSVGVAVRDGANWHLRDKDLIVPANVRPLPPCRPN